MSSSKKSRTDKEMINFDELKAEEESYGEEESEEEEDHSSRFPYPLNRETINKTPSIDLTAGKGKDQIGDKKKLKNIVKAAHSNTKSFLGISNAQSGQPGQSINNWNERVFKVMSNNSIFGGELKERKIDQYIEGLDEDHVDAANPFLYYKLTGNNQIRLVPKITVANMAMNGVRKLKKVCFSAFSN